MVAQIALLAERAPQIEDQVLQLAGRPTRRPVGATGTTGRGHLCRRPALTIVPDIRAGQTLEAVLATLRGLGLPSRQEGSADRPKLAGEIDLLLLRSIPGWSAYLLFVAAPGTLRTMISWDQPGVNLNLVVVGFTPTPPFFVSGSCIQWTPPGGLGELCDRPPQAPVPGRVFLVVVVNVSPTPQAYLLSLSP